MAVCLLNKIKTHNFELKGTLLLLLSQAQFPLGNWLLGRNPQWQPPKGSALWTKGMGQLPQQSYAEKREACRRNGLLLPLNKALTLGGNMPCRPNAKTKELEIAAYDSMRAMSRTYRT